MVIKNPFCNRGNRSRWYRQKRGNKFLKYLNINLKFALNHRFSFKINLKRSFQKQLFIVTIVTMNKKSN